jgi:hypothetical protein
MKLRSLETPAGVGKKPAAPVLVASSYFVPGKQIYNSTFNNTPGSGKVAMSPSSVAGLEYAGFFPVRTNVNGVNVNADGIAKAIAQMFTAMGVANKLIKPSPALSGAGVPGANRYDVYVQPENLSIARDLISNEDYRQRIYDQLVNYYGFTSKVAVGMVATMFYLLTGGGNRVPSPI